MTHKFLEMLVCCAIINCAISMFFSISCHKGQHSHELPTNINGIQRRNGSERQSATDATRDTEKPERFRRGGD